MSEFIKKQREHAESLKLGRTVAKYDFQKDGKVTRKLEREDAAKKPPLTTILAYPARTGMGTCKPGCERE